MGDDGIRLESVTRARDGWARGACASSSPLLSPVSLYHLDMFVHDRTAHREGPGGHAPYGVLKAPHPLEKAEWDAMSCLRFETHPRT